jgi:hypothetical protein
MSPEVIDGWLTAWEAEARQGGLIRDPATYSNARPPEPHSCGALFD